MGYIPFGSINCKSEYNPTTIVIVNVNLAFEKCSKTVDLVFIIIFILGCFLIILLTKAF
jgi:hypothetical protein